MSHHTAIQGVLFENLSKKAVIVRCGATALARLLLGRRSAEKRGIGALRQHAAQSYSFPENCAVLDLASI